jgi:hypothetical protein
MLVDHAPVDEQLANNEKCAERVGTNGKCVVDGCDEFPMIDLGIHMPNAIKIADNGNTDISKPREQRSRDGEKRMTP